MPRDEPVGPFGRLALKPTEFREQLGLIGFAVLHDVPPFAMIRIVINSLGKQAPNRGAGEDRNATRLESRDQPLLPMARLNV